MKTPMPLIATFLAVGVIHLHAATITVTGTADGGAGTLRNALASAADGDTIDATSVSGTILLTSGELLVTNSVDIIGPGPDWLAVNGNFPNTTNRVFHIGSNTLVSIASLTVTNGYAPGFDGGGGIYNDHATLTVTNCTLSGNRADTCCGGSGGGIFNESGTLIVNNSTLNGNSANQNGGGIDNFFGTLTVQSSTLGGNSASNNSGGAINSESGTVVISNCTLSGNSASYGGALVILGYDEGPDGTFISTSTIQSSTLSSNTAGYGGAIENGCAMTISDCTLSGNSASGNGGGIWNLITLTVINSTLSSNSADHGGGIYNEGVFGTNDVSINNSTLSGNRARGAGGAILNFGSLSIQSSTLSGNSATNGGAIFGGAAEIGSTILNAGASGGNFKNSVGTVTSLGYNLSSDDGAGFLTATGDQINTDPLLGPLQDNGGPTFTHALLCGSPAIDQGKNFSASATDQRGAGFARTFDDPTVANATGGDGTDIGAFEVQQGDCAAQDTDGDGVADAIDQCPGTPPGAIVDASGCSLAQLVPCDGPLSGGAWKNHGQYVSAVVHAATDFLKARLITRRQWVEIVADAAQSKCGWNRRFDHD